MQCNLCLRVLEVYRQDNLIWNYSVVPCLATMTIFFNGLRFGVSTHKFWGTRACTCVAVRFKPGSWRLRPEDTIAADRQSDSAVINCYRINDVPAHRRPRSWHPFWLPGSCARHTFLSCGRASSEDEPRSDNQTPDIDFGNFLRYCVIISRG